RQRNSNRYRKETFVQANYRFFLSPTSDHQQSLADPDHPVEWEAVQLVCIHTATPPHCPICLETPVAAKITKCGHIFCYPCILHYLSIGERSWKRCPLCFESIFLK